MTSLNVAMEVRIVCMIESIHWRDASPEWPWISCKWVEDGIIHYDDKEIACPEPDHSSDQAQQPSSCVE